MRWFGIGGRPKLGLVEAQFQLGLIYLHGHEAHPGLGGPRHWLQFASQRDDELAQSTLDALFPNGISVAADLDEALRWLRAAAEAGKAEAQVVLGDLARSGRGGTQDYDEARRWFEAAARGRLGRRANSISATSTIKGWA